jgi:hypothetical protein
MQSGWNAPPQGCGTVSGSLAQLRLAQFGLAHSRLTRCKLTQCGQLEKEERS